MTYYRSHSIRVTSTTELGEEAESLLIIYLISSYTHYSRRLSFKKRVQCFISHSNTLGLFSDCFVKVIHKNAGALKKKKPKIKTIEKKMEGEVQTGER